MTGALSDIRVVEFAQNFAAPQCGRILAGMGADVIKVEPPEGDAMRHLAVLAPNEGRAYGIINPGKRSMCLDLGAGDAGEIVDRLIRWADIAIVGLKIADLVRFGLDWERVHELNPSLIQVVVSAFGPHGPEAERGGYDVLVQGMSGLGFMMNRSGSGAPLPTRPAVFDGATGMMASSAAIAALRHRDRTGVGQRVDASLLGTAIGMGLPVVASFGDRTSGPMAEISDDIALLREAGADFDTQRGVYDSRTIPAGGAFRLYFRHYLTADGLISVAGLSRGLFEKFHEITGVSRPEGIDPGSDAFANIVREAEEAFSARTTGEWLDVMQQAGYPCARYNMPDEAAHDPQVRANDYVVELNHEVWGAHAIGGMPVHMSETPTAITTPSPQLGQHTREMLTELGFDADQVTNLEASGAVRSLQQQAP